MHARACRWEGGAHDKGAHTTERDDGKGAHTTERDDGKGAHTTEHVHIGREGGRGARRRNRLVKGSPGNSDHLWGRAGKQGHLHRCGWVKRLDAGVVDSDNERVILYLSSSTIAIAQSVRRIWKVRVTLRRLCELLRPGSPSGTGGFPVVIPYARSGARGQ